MQRFQLILTTVVWCIMGSMGCTWGKTISERSVQAAAYCDDGSHCYCGGIDDKEGEAGEVQLK